jgi:hypothetical protein
MNAAAYLGFTEWRLPTVTDIGNDGCNFAYAATDCGFNVNLFTGEMAWLYYSTLSNRGLYDTSGNVNLQCPNISLCPVDDGPFSNLRIDYYWASTELANVTDGAWGFYFNTGGQGPNNKASHYYAWPVLNGDPLAVVPTPAAAWLFGSALGGLAWRRRLPPVRSRGAPNHA